MLDYLLKTLLRMHLAPRREAALYDRKKAHRTRSEKRSTNAASLLSLSNNSLWKKKHKSLCNALAKELVRYDGDRTKKGPQVILKALQNHSGRKPTGSVSASASASTSASTSASASASTFTSGDGNLPEEDLDDILEEHLEFNQDGDLDNIEEDLDLDFNEEVQNVGNPSSSSSSEKESSANKIKALKVVLTMLVESPSINYAIDAAYVKRLAHTGKEFTDDEATLVAKLANLLRPYVPKRRPGKGTRTVASLAHVALRAPIVLLANAVLRATGYHNFTRSISPEVSPSATHSIHIGAVALYEIFLSQRRQRFVIPGLPITRVESVTNPRENADAIIWAFFDFNKVTSICNRHKLDFHKKYIYR